MVTRHNLDCFDEFTARFILSKVRRLIGRAGLTTSDRADLIQEFALDLLQRRVHFDPGTASWEAFVVVVCENRYASILQHRLARMRSHHREGASLNGPVGKSGSKRADIGSTLADNQQNLRTGQRRRPAEEASDLRQDVASLLDGLPPRLREICERLKGSSKASVARELGMSQGAFYQLLEIIRGRFEKAGLRDYLK